MMLDKYKSKAESIFVKSINVAFSTRCIVIVLFSSILSACGFHLRGDYLVPEEISSLSLTSFDSYSQLTRNIDAQLRLNEIEVVAPASDVPNLHLINESTTERTLSLYQNATAAEKELTYNASFRVTIPEMGTKTYSTTVTRNYLDNPRTALAKSVEKEMIKDEMRMQAATQIIRQMARLKAELDEGTEIEFDKTEKTGKDSANTPVQQTTTK